MSSHCVVPAFISAVTLMTAMACDQVPAGDDAEPPVILAFDRTLLLEQEGTTSANVSIGDLDRDGHLDIVLVKGRHGSQARVSEQWAWRVRGRLAFRQRRLADSSRQGHGPER